MSEKVVIKLKKPVQFGTEEITEISLLKEIRSKHLKKLPLNLKNMAWEHMMVVAQAISDQPMKVFDELSFDDLGEIAGHVGEALGVGEKTGSD